MNHGGILAGIHFQVYSSDGQVHGIRDALLGSDMSGHLENVVRMD